MDKRKKKSTETRRTLLLVTATETEALFFSQMRKDCRYGNLTVVNSGAKDLRRLIQFTSREKNRNRYDVAYALFGLDDVALTFDEGAIEAIADKTIARKTGARGLRAIMENAMMDLMFQLPSVENVESCVVTKEMIEGTGDAILTYKEEPKGRRKRRLGIMEETA